MKRRGFLAVKIALSAALLTWILMRPEVGSLLPLLQQARMGWIAAGFGCAGLAILGIAWRWQACLQALGIEIRLLEIFRIVLAATAAGYFSIGQLGVDAAKILLAGRRIGGRHAALTASVSLDHASSLPVMVGLFLLAIVPHGIVPTLREHGMWPLAVTGVLFVVGGLVVRWKWPDVHRRVMAVFADRRVWRGFAIAACRSLPLWMAYCGTFYCAARAFGVEVPPISFAGVTVIADAIASLPISLAGLGVREQAFQTLLHNWHGVPLAAAVALSLTGFVIMLSWAMLGAGWILAEPVTSKQP